MPRDRLHGNRLAVLWLTMLGHAGAGCRAEQARGQPKVRRYWRQAGQGLDVRAAPARQFAESRAPGQISCGHKRPKLCFEHWAVALGALMKR